MSRNYPHLRHFTVAWVALLVCLPLSSLATAAGNSLSNAPSSLNTGLEAPLEFLPVEEAYRLLPSLEGETLIIDWMIAPGHYLWVS